MSDWIEWAGGECPVSRGVRVDVMFRDGTSCGLLAPGGSWRHDGGPDDIVAYHVIETHPGPITITGDWIEWWGGTPPVLHTSAVEVKFRNGEKSPEAREASKWAWTHGGGSYDIVAYRVVDAQPGPITMDEPASALAVQEGGDHYKKLAIQPIEYIHANGIPFAEGNVIKYVSRWRDKGGIKDLEKARHFLDLLIELETKGGAR